MDLVIVESPAKAKTIGKYLGDNYRIEATMGHLRDLPKNDLGVTDPDQSDFSVTYQPIKGKEATIETLRKAANKSETVYLATDPDREGEAISWHLKELLGIKEAKRVTFNEITKKVVTESIKHPREIDQSLVDAQQARRVLDRIVGYKISPLLWRKIKTGLSAGRVQSVATRIVVDRENEIRAFVPEEYWSIDVDLSRIAPKIGDFTATYFAPEGQKRENLPDKESADAVIADLKKSTLNVARVGHSEKRRSPAPPFTTSTMQQEASRRHGFTARRTMAAAQALYETGLITYMRTDSLRLSDEAVDAARDLIKTRYGAQFLPQSRRVYKTKTQAQDAHEAIRPSVAAQLPEHVKSQLTSDQYKTYKMIWERFIACQMENAVYDTLTIDVLAAGGAKNRIFRANNTTVVFAGFTAVHEETREDEDEEKTATLPDMQEGEPVKAMEILPLQHFTQPPPRYSEATLIKALEEHGIGRPSTYAPTVSIILDREYVVKENSRLRPTPLGEVINGLMLDKFNNIIDLEFTARMERELDSIEAGKKPWKEMITEFYGPFARDLTAALEDQSGRLKIPDEPSDIVCDLCGRKMVKKTGRFGRFLACPGYPDCKNTKPLAEETPGMCPKCGNTILKQKSKKGYTYFACSHYPKCEFITWDVPQKETCELCGQSLFKTGGRGTKKTFCINPECANFLPEEQRRFKKKEEDSESSDKKKTPAKKTKKTAAAKTAAAKKTAAKPATAKKTAAAKKTVVKKPATAKKPAAKK